MRTMTLFAGDFGRSTASGRGAWGAVPGATETTKAVDVGASFGLAATKAVDLGAPFGLETTKAVDVDATFGFDDGALAATFGFACTWP